MDGRLLILVGPSAVGKTTVMDELLRREPRFTPIRSMTTRPPRTAADTEYLHVDAETFAQAIGSGELLEHVTYGPYSYGTPRTELTRAFSDGRIPLLILEHGGARSIKEGPLGARTYVAYLYDALDVMEERLYARELAVCPSAEALMTFARRKAANIADYLDMRVRAPYYDVFVRNVTPAETAAAILEDFQAQRRAPDPEREQVLAYLEADAQKKENYRA